MFVPRVAHAVEALRRGSPPPQACSAADAKHMSSPTCPVFLPRVAHAMEVLRRGSHQSPTSSGLRPTSVCVVCCQRVLSHARILPCLLRTHKRLLVCWTLRAPRPTASGHTRSPPVGDELVGLAGAGLAAGVHRLARRKVVVRVPACACVHAARSVCVQSVCALPRRTGAASKLCSQQSVIHYAVQSEGREAQARTTVDMGGRLTCGHRSTWHSGPPGCSQSPHASSMSRTGL